MAGALGVITVVFVPQLSDIVFTPEMASIMTLAFGTLFAGIGRFVGRWLPKPS